MAKKNKKRKKVIKQKRTSPVKFDQKAFISDLENQTMRIFQGLIFPIEQRIESLAESIQNVKTNVVVTNSLLERKNLISRKEFFKEIEEYVKLEGSGTVDEQGKMEGNSVISIYNYGE